MGGRGQHTLDNGVPGTYRTPRPRKTLRLLNLRLPNGCSRSHSTKMHPHDTWSRFVPNLNATNLRYLYQGWKLSPRQPEIKPRQYGRPSEKGCFECKTAATSGLAAAGAAAGGSPAGRVRDNRESPAPAAAPAATKPPACPYCLGLISG